MYFLDYLQYTIKLDVYCPEQAIDLIEGYMNIDLLDYQYEVKKGLNGYNQRLIFENGIIICYCGNEGMGTNVILSGTTIKNLKQDINDILYNVVNSTLEYNITRIDIAVDTTVPFCWFYQKEKRKEYITRSKIHKHLNDDNRGTIYVGVRGSNQFLRIYDKALEQKVQDNSIVWTRVEAEFRNEYAKKVANIYLEQNNISEYINNHFRIIVERVSNMSRDAVICPNWLQIIKGDGLCKSLYESKDNDTEKWICDKLAPTLKAFVKVYGQQELLNAIEESHVSQQSYNKMRTKRKIKDLKAI